MTVNLLDIIKSLPLKNHENVGLAVNLLDIYSAAKIKGLTNTDIINCKLRDLANNNIIELCYVDRSFDESMFWAVKLL